MCEGESCGGNGRRWFGGGGKLLGGGGKWYWGFTTPAFSGRLVGRSLGLAGGGDGFASCHGGRRMWWVVMSVGDEKGVVVLGERVWVRWF